MRLCNPIDFFGFGQFRKSLNSLAHSFFYKDTDFDPL